jgi:hypothetical protein
MSDTPRTEAEVNRPHGPLDGIVTIDADFAAQLERELNAANDRIKLLKITGDELLEWLKDGTISDSNYRLLANAWQRAKENKQ